MKRTPFADWPCSVARTVDILGDWWTPLVLRESYLGVRRFDDFQHRLGIGRNILTQRLGRLVDEGLLARRPYQERPLRHEYVLTDKGRDFYPVMAAITSPRRSRSAVRVWSSRTTSKTTRCRVCTSASASTNHP